MINIKEIYLIYPNIENYILSLKNNLNMINVKNSSYIKFTENNITIFLYNKKSKYFFCNHDYFYNSLSYIYKLKNDEIKIIVQEIMNKYKIKINYKNFFVIFNCAINNNYY